MPAALSALRLGAVLSALLISTTVASGEDADSGIFSWFSAKASDAAASFLELVDHTGGYQAATGVGLSRGGATMAEITGTANTQATTAANTQATTTGTSAGGEHNAEETAETTTEPTQPSEVSIARSTWERRKQLVEEETADLNMQINHMMELRTMTWNSLVSVKSSVTTAKLQLEEIKNSIVVQKETKRQLLLEIKMLEEQNKEGIKNRAKQTTEVFTLTQTNINLDLQLKGCQSKLAACEKGDHVVADTPVDNCQGAACQPKKALVNAAVPVRQCTAKGSSFCCSDKAAPPAFLEGECRGKFCNHLCSARADEAEAVCGCDCGNQHAASNARARGCASHVQLSQEKRPTEGSPSEASVNKDSTAHW